MERISRTKLGNLSMLRHKKYRDKAALFIAEGRKCVADTAAGFDIDTLVASETFLESEDGRALAVNASEVFYGTSADLGRISSLVSTPDVVAVFRRNRVVVDTEVVIGDISLMLDSVQDPGNVGTIVRLADWFGIRYIFASPDSADAFSPKAVMASMGSLSRVNVVSEPLLEVCAQFPHVPICALMLEGENIYDVKLPIPSFIVMGNEGNGVSRTIRSYAKYGLRIPSYPENAPTAESLNVAMATAVTLSEFRRRMC